MNTTQVKVFFPQHYEHRGEGLRMLNRVEYYCLVQVKPKPSDDEDGITTDEADARSTRGRQKSRTFDFGPGHPLRATHTQVLRSIQTIPMYTGKPPRMPGMVTDEMGAEERKKFDDFAAYYLTAFRPELDDYDDDHRDSQLCYDWETFCDFVSQLESDGSFISDARLSLMHSTIQGLTTDNEAKVLLAKYRKRNRDKWSKEESERAQEILRAEGDGFVRKEFGDEFLQDMDESVLSTRDVLRGMMMTKYSDGLVQALSATTSNLSATSAPAIRDDEHTKDDMLLDIDLYRVTNIFDAIRNYARHDEDVDIDSDNDSFLEDDHDESDNDDGSVLQQCVEEAKTLADTYGFTASQQKLMDELLGKLIEIADDRATRYFRSKLSFVSRHWRSRHRKVLPHKGDRWHHKRPKVHHACQSMLDGCGRGEHRWQHNLDVL